MFGNLLAPEIGELIAARNFGALREVFSEWPAADLAELIGELPVADQVVVFRILPRETAADVFEYLDIDAQKGLLTAMGQEDVVNVINEMSPDDRTALLEELPAAAVTGLMRLLSPEERAVSQALLGYPEGSVGRLMTPNFVPVKAAWTVQETLDYIREHGRDSETLNALYITDDGGRLIDDLKIREILLRPLATRLSEIHDENFVALRVSDDQGVAVEAFKKYDRNTLPVVDSAGVLVGIVTVDDVIDVIEEETTEDIQKMGGTEALDEPYLESPFLSLVKKRAVWLVVLFLGETLTASALGHYEHVIQQAVVLAIFVPLIISSGGNSGSQASTLIIRAMALGEITLSDWWAVMRKEVLSGLALGSILGGIGFARVALGAQLSPAYGPHWPLVGATLAVTLVAVVLWGTLAGSMLPLVLKRLGIDPATSSGPFVATLVDVTGLVIYFSVATALLKGTML
jgi:magnesium transporter